VRDYWREGSLAVLAALARSPAQQLPDFITYLLELRILLAPAYARQAVEQDPEAVAALLADTASLSDDPSAFARRDWDLHIGLTRLARNPVFQLLYNGFHELSLLMGEHYFASPAGRQSSRRFYAALLDCARRGDASGAEALVRRVMEESLALHLKMQKENA
jgi:GntR family negative regulator for fad regulon and positive regulator of fabA